MIALSMAVAAGSALGFSTQMTPEYEARAKVFVGPRSVERDDAASTIQELTFSREFVASYAEMLKSRPLAEKVVEKTGAPTTGAALARRVETRVIPETRLIEVAVTHPSPQWAEVFANEIVNIFVTDAGDQFGGGGAVSASLFEPALRPTSPVSPKPIQNGIIGSLLGAMLGVGIVFLMEQLDTALRTKQDVERALAPLPVIGQIPLAPHSRNGRVFVDTHPDSPQAEALRILRTNIQFCSVEHPVKKAIVTSPFAQDGKTTVAVNLAASMAATGSRVLLIETDMRRPMLHEVLDVPNRAGLSNVLAGQVSLDRAVQRTRVSNLEVVTAGVIPPNPSELLGSRRMADVLAEAEGMADMVLLDSPPALPVTDAAVLAPHTDGVILVVRAGRTDRNKAMDVVRNFERHDVRILGVVVNGLERDGEGGYYYNYYRAVGKGRRRGPGEAQTMDDFIAAPNKPASRPSRAPSFTEEAASSVTEVEPAGDASPRRVRAASSSSALPDRVTEWRRLAGQSGATPEDREAFQQPPVEYPEPIVAGPKESPEDGRAGRIGRRPR